MASNLSLQCLTCDKPLSKPSAATKEPRFLQPSLTADLQFSKSLNASAFLAILNKPELPTQANVKPRLPRDSAAVGRLKTVRHFGIKHLHALGIAFKVDK